MGNICMGLTGASTYNSYQGQSVDGTYQTIGTILPFTNSTEKLYCLEYVKSIPKRITWIPEKKTHILEKVSWNSLLIGASECGDASPTKDSVLDVDGFFHCPCYTFNDFIWEFKTAGKWIAGHLEWINHDKSRVYISQFKQGKFITPSVVYTDKLQREQYGKVEGEVKCIGTTYSHALLCFIDTKTVRIFQFGFDGLDDLQMNLTTDRIYRRSIIPDQKDTVKYRENHKQYSHTQTDYSFPQSLVANLKENEMTHLPVRKISEEEALKELQKGLSEASNILKDHLEKMKPLMNKK